jgi:Nickel responsive protein SCO4226-like
MAPKAATDPGTVYLVEHYRPGLEVMGLRHLAALVREALDELQREGRSVRLARTAVVPADESVLCIVEAESEELVSEAYMRAGLSFERISIVVPEEASVPTRRGSTRAAS